MRKAFGTLSVILTVGLTPAFAQSPSPSAPEGGSPASPPPAAAVAPPPAAAPAQAVSAQSGAVNVGPLRNIKFQGLVQEWFQAGDEGFVNGFRLRRTELYLSADVTSRARFMVMIDPSKALSMNNRWATVGGTSAVSDTSVNQATRILQDAYISVALVPHLDVQVGQFKLPLNFEGLASSWALPLVERSLITTDKARGGAFGDVRDIGLMARGTFASGLEYRVGVFNGLGANQNDTDKDDRKAVAGRVFYKTPVKGLQVGGFAAADRDTATAIERRKMGVDAQYVRGPLLLQAELVGGKDGALDRRGYYATVGYRVTKAAELVARYDTWDPDTNFDTTAANVAERDYDFGLNYYLSGNNLKCQAEYLRKTFVNDVTPSRNVVLVNLQVSW